MCARCGETIEASRCAARAGARANDTAHADVRVHGAARARASARADEAARDSALSRRRPRERSRRCGGGGGERRRTIASSRWRRRMAACTAICKGVMRSHQSRTRAPGPVEVEAAWRIPLTWHTSRVKAEPQGAGNVYSLRGSSGVGTVLICRRHQQWGGARIAAHPRREANGGRRPRRARARSSNHRRQRLLRSSTGPTLRIRGPSCVYAAHRA